ncbi:hypothetical protein N7528_004731 [Penicillium herquei]|nr:hypothetical protein N7528_004731 [Penicillium herquei]
MRIYSSRGNARHSLKEKRACANCSRAKAKCAPVDNDSDICQRCLKHNLTCSKTTPVSTRRRGKATHAKALEKKLDDIMALLAKQQDHTHCSERRTRFPTAPNDSAPAIIPRPGDASYEDQSLAGSLNQLAGTNSPEESISIVPGFEVTFSEADEILEEYMTTMLPEFPFIPIPSKNSSQMLEDKPLLLKTILWACRPPPPEVSAAFEHWFRQHIATQTVTLMKKDLELVQAILIFLAWNDIYFYATTKDTALVQLAICLIDDLGLTRPRWREGLAFESIVEDAAQMQNKLSHPPKQTRAECRTLMGVYYMTSSLLGKRYRLEYTAHFDEYCKKLQTDQEYPTDSLLVSLVGIRKIAMKVNNFFWELIGNPNNQPSGGVFSIAMASIQNELDTFMNELPESLKWNHLLRTHCASIRIRLFEPFKFGEKCETLGPTHLRSRMIWDCLQSTHELYDAFRLVPVESIPPLTVISILHIALAIIKASRLLCVEDPAWDLSTARTMFNLPGILQQLSKVFEDASSRESPRSMMTVHGLPIFSEYAEAYRGIERLYINRLNTNALSNSSNSMLNPINESDISGDHGFDFWEPIV